jgi:hypothetical protein
MILLCHFATGQGENWSPVFGMKWFFNFHGSINNTSNKLFTSVNDNLLSISTTMSGIISL